MTEERLYFTFKDINGDIQIMPVQGAVHRIGGQCWCDPEELWACACEGEPDADGRPQPVPECPRCGGRGLYPVPEGIDPLSDRIYRHREVYDEPQSVS